MPSPRINSWREDWRQKHHQEAWCSTMHLFKYWIKHSFCFPFQFLDPVASEIWMIETQIHICFGSMYLIPCHLEELVKVGLANTMGNSHLIRLHTTRQWQEEAFWLMPGSDFLHGMVISLCFLKHVTLMIISEFYLSFLDWRGVRGTWMASSNFLASSQFNKLINLNHCRLCF